MSEPKPGLRKALPAVIETKRLVLRPFGFADVDDVLAYAGDEEWGRYLSVPHPYVRSHAEQFVAQQVLLDRKINPAWAMALEGTVVGGISIRFDFEQLVGALGYSIARALWGKGLTTEAARAVVDSAFRTHSDLRRLCGMADSRNIGSQRVMEKIGMRREGVLRQNRLARNEPVDEVWFGILRPEWEEARA